MTAASDRETPYVRLGGADGIAALIEEFYARVERDPDLRPIYPEDLGPGKRKLGMFLVQWLGGPAAYTAAYGHPRLRRRHFPFVIDDRAAGRWLKHMREAMMARAVPADEIDGLFAHLAPLAHHMVNAGEDVPREPLGDTWME